MGTTEGGVGFASGFGWSKFCFEVVLKLGRRRLSRGDEAGRERDDGRTSDGVWTRPRRGPGQSLDAETAVTGNEEGNHVPRLVVSSHGKRG